MHQRYVALLRGVNVGVGNRIAMADFRALLTSLGFTDVRTLLNSGNAIFTASSARAKHAALRVEQALLATLNVRSRVTVLSATELDALVQANPWPNDALDPSKLMLSVFADHSVATRLAPVQTRSWEPEWLVVGARAAYVWCPNGLTGSAIFPVLARLLGDAVTTRNWATVGKLQAMIVAMVGVMVVGT